LNKSFRQNQPQNPPSWRSVFRRLLTPREQTAAESHTIELDNLAFGVCREIAATRQISMKDAVSYLARMYEEERNSQLMLQASDEQLIRNPLLALDALIGRAADKEGFADDERS
jgi:hypothetical protein